jgi:succinate dehydrogenase / fumarate reductase cytochrome b subunit
MSAARSVFRSSVVKKALMAATGLGMIVFLILHLAGNLTLLAGSADRYNAYSNLLTGLGPLLYGVEIGLVVLFLVHVIEAVAVWLEKRRARPEPYQRTAHAGGPSRMGLSSRTMIWTGAFLLVFTVVHLKTFKFGPGIEQGYVATVHGTEMRDLYRLVSERFQQAGYVAFYVVSMVFLGMHLRHGFWSAFQSLGIQGRRLTDWLYRFGLALAVVLAAGYLVIPVWMYVRGGLP